MKGEISMVKLKEITTAKEINTMLEEKAFMHTYYYHYSDIKGISGILKSKKLWISSMCFSNDMMENNRFDDDTYLYFQFCFSTGTTENLPLWFLYSGINGKGARLILTKKEIKKLCDFDNMQMELFNVINGKREKLINGKNCRVEFKDILYHKKENQSYRLKYNTQVKNDFSPFEMSEVEKKNKAFLKDIIWFYEKETRILIKVDKSIIDKTLFKDAKESPYRIELSIPDDCYKNIQFSLSPVYDGSNIKEIDEILYSKGVIQLHSAKILSEYAGQIKIDLCKKCRN